jgi:hypothetical protein
MRIVRLAILVMLLLIAALMATDSPGSAERQESPSTATVGAAGASESSSITNAESGVGPEVEGGEQPLTTFVPTERLPADSAISFPVDI